MSRREVWWSAVGIFLVARGFPSEPFVNWVAWVFLIVRDVSLLM